LLGESIDALAALFAGELLVLERGQIAVDLRVDRCQFRDSRRAVADATASSMRSVRWYVVIMASKHGRFELVCVTANTTTGLPERTNLTALVLGPPLSGWCPSTAPAASRASASEVNVEGIGVSIGLKS
jgi:hypothetical protein